MDAAELPMQSDVDLANVLADIIGRPPWHRDAASADHPVGVFLPARDEPTGSAKAICAGCLVAEECAPFALEHDDLAGVWAGTSPGQRQAA